MMEKYYCKNRKIIVFKESESTIHYEDERLKDYRYYCDNWENDKRLELSFDIDGMPIVKKYLLDENGHKYSYYDESNVVDEIIQPDYDLINKIIVPEVVTMRQARLALLQSGILSDVETAIKNGTDEVLKIEWEYSTTVKRDWQNLITLASSLGLTEQHLDDLFTLANTL